jgi:hypothetical protein
VVIDFNSRDNRKMNWLQIVILILNLLKQAKQHESAEGFAASAGAVGANGDLLKWVWANRQAIVDFLNMLINFAPGPAVMGSSASVAEVRAWIAELKD